MSTPEEKEKEFWSHATLRSTLQPQVTQAHRIVTTHECEHAQVRNFLRVGNLGGSAVEHG